METKIVPGPLGRETHPSRSCLWGMGCICMVMGLLDAFCFDTHQVLHSFWWCNCRGHPRI